VRIRVVQSGGLAGLRSEHELDTDSLPVEMRERLEGLVQGSAFFAREGRGSGAVSKLPDMIQYRVRIEEGSRAHEVTFDDSCGETPLLELVERVTELARAQH
jgi:hypothetical protein